MEIIDDSLSYELNPNYIYFFVKGELTLKSVVSWLKEIIKTAKENGSKKTLIEGLFFNDLEYKDLIEISFEFVNLGMKDFKMAFIDSNPKNITMNSFLQQAVDIDKINSKIFDNKKEALEWLVSDSKAST